MAVKKEILFRSALVYVVFLIFGIAIISRILYIQIVQGNDLRSKAQKLTLKNCKVEPARGDILACDGRLLATSIPSYEIRMDMKAKGLIEDTFYRYVDSLSLCLTNLFKDKSKQEYKNELKTAYKEGKRYFLIKRKVDYISLKQLKKFPLFRLGNNKSGLVYTQDNIRFQPNITLALRTIGYTTESGTSVGLEGRFDEDLKGVQGVRFMQRLSGGAWMPVSDKNEVEPRDGNDIETTIDIELQDVAENALLKQLEQNDADHGCVVLMEVKTGEIKAIANLGKNEKGEYIENFNYAVGESTEPGSTFKLASMIAILEDGYVQTTDTVDTKKGEVNFYGQPMKDSDEKGHGKITVQQAFEVSSNIGISLIINRNYEKRPKQYIDHLYALRLNEPLHLDINGEGKPYIKYPNDKHWARTSLPWISIGYEVRVTPLQTLTLYNAIANDGKMVKPHFVKAISYHGKVLKTFDTETIESSICTSSTLKKVRKMLEGVVRRGTATNLNHGVFRIAGKTGTALIAKSRKGYSLNGKNYQASFVGYFPADRPLYSCIVVVNNPKNAYYGNVAAGPVFKEIADKVYATSPNFQRTIDSRKDTADAPIAKIGLKKDLDYLYNKLNISITNDNDVKSDWISVAKDEKSIKYSDIKTKAKSVPNVVNMGLKDALFLLENAGLKVVVKGCGKVSRQSIAPGTHIKNGEIIVLEMSLS
jgi:cell division protein FtsI (penicillin-binding protein 3)